MNQAITESEKADALVDFLTPDLIELMREAYGSLEALEQFCGMCDKVGVDYMQVLDIARQRGLVN